MKIVFVVWLDAASNDSWTATEGAMEQQLHEIHTVGHLISENEQKIVVGLSKDLIGDSVSNYIAIPKVWIKDRKELKMPRARKAKKVETKNS